MKLKKLLLIILSIIFTYCTKKEKKPNYVVFSGTIESPISDSLRIYNMKNKKIHTIFLSENDSFRDTLTISKGYYSLFDGQNFIKLFLKPSTNLNTTISYNGNEILFSFNDNGAKENIYFKKKEKFEEKLKIVESSKYFLNLNENDFLELADSIKAQKIKFLQDFSDIDSNLLGFETFEIEFENARLRERYQKWRGRYIKDKSFQVSPNYPNPFENIDLSNENLIGYPGYLSAIGFALNYRTDNQIVKFELLSFLESIEEKINNQRIIDELAYTKTEFILQGNKIISELEYSKFMALVMNEEYKREIDKYYQNIRRLSFGTVSPSFELYDINNRLVSLESLKGKLVYIDIWASWCIPCIKEFPALKIIEKEFENEEISFVGMCLNDSKENFEKMVKEKNLSGVQLFVPNDEISFFEEYSLTTIPRFILIDKEGKILDAYAYPPSDPKLKELILKHI